MKWLFVAMLAVNVAFALSHTVFGDERPVAQKLAANPLPDHVNRLLLAELGDWRLRERSATGATVAAADTGQPTSVDDTGASDSRTGLGTVCLSVGPLANAEDVERVGNWLGVLSMAPALRHIERREISRFWVFSPPMPTPAAALEWVQEIAAEHVEDIYVIPGGDMANAVSLGLYSHKSSLDRRLAELAAKGYQPSTTLRYESKTASWYDLELDEGEEYLYAAFLTAFPDLEASEVSCS